MSFPGDGGDDEIRVTRLQLGDDELLAVSWPLSEPPSMSRLTRAERAVALSVVEGKDTARIAHERGVSPHTVAHQLGSVYRKLDVASREELVALFDAEPEG